MAHVDAGVRGRGPAPAGWTRRPGEAVLTSPRMTRTLIICEKPSVARDVANALPGGAARKGAEHYEGPEANVAFAVGHLVEQVDPDAYDERFKKWRYEDLPIVPQAFRYEARDARAAKQLKSLHTLMARPRSPSSSTPVTPAARAS